MKAIVNKAHVEGVVYEHKLQAKVTGENSKNPGTEYITGELRVLTDPETNNIVPVHFTYLTATTKAGKENATYTVLKKIIDGVLPTQMDGGNTISVNLLQPSKTASPISVNELLRVTFVSFMHCLNAEASIVATPSGMTML